MSAQAAAMNKIAEAFRSPMLDFIRDASIMMHFDEPMIPISDGVLLIAESMGTPILNQDSKDTVVQATPTTRSSTAPSADRQQLSLCNPLNGDIGLTAQPLPPKPYKPHFQSRRQDHVVAPQFQLPPGKSWSSVVFFNTEDTQNIQIKIGDNATVTIPYWKFGMDSKQTTKPTKSWDLLREIIARNGFVEDYRVLNYRNKRALITALSSLRQKLKLIFGTNKNPFDYKRLKNGIKASFAACEHAKSKLDNESFEDRCLTKAYEDRSVVDVMYSNGRSHISDACVYQQVYRCSDVEGHDL